MNITRSWTYPMSQLGVVVLVVVVDDVDEDVDEVARIVPTITTDPLSFQARYNDPSPSPRDVRLVGIHQRLGHPFEAPIKQFNDQDQWLRAIPSSF